VERQEILQTGRIAREKSDPSQTLYLERLTSFSVDFLDTVFSLFLIVLPWDESSRPCPVGLSRPASLFLVIFSPFRPIVSDRFRKAHKNVRQQVADNGRYAKNIVPTGAVGYRNFGGGGADFSFDTELLFRFPS